MKSLFLSLFTFLLFSFQSIAQLDKWVIPPYLVDLSTETATLLNQGTNTNGYDREKASYHSNAWFDDNGQLQFFIVDDKVYDSTGELLGTLTFANSEEIVIFPSKTDCNEFLIVRTWVIDPEVIPYLVVDKVNMTKRNVSNHQLIEIPCGEACEESGGIDNRDKDLDDFEEEKATCGDLNLEISYNPILDDYLLFVQTCVNLMVAKIIKVDNDIQMSGFFPSVFIETPAYTGFSSVGATGATYSRDELEVRSLDNGRFVVASLSKYDISISLLTSEFTEYMEDPYVITTGPGVIAEKEGYNTSIDGINRVRGLEFSPSGNYVYVTSTASPYLYYMDISNLENDVDNENTWTAPDIIGMTAVEGFANAIEYGKSMIEVGQDGKLYLFNGSKLLRIDNPENPSTTDFTEIDLGFSSSIPPTLGLVENTATEIYNLPEQVNHTTFVSNHYASIACCHANINYYDATSASGSYTWNNITREIRGKLIIDKNEVVTFNNCTLRFADDRFHDETTKIIVKRGGKLIINNSTLSSVDCSGSMWNGIEVWGSRDVSQNNTSKRGLLVIENSELSNATNCVALIRKADNGNNIWSYTGGIIKATNSTFRNNKRDVEFMSYSFPNQSFFKGCNFITDDELKNGDDPFFHVTLWDVEGVTFIGNNFENTRFYQEADGPQRGGGIGTIQSDITVKAGNVPGYAGGNKHNTFSHLYYGISINAGAGMPNTIIHNTGFEFNQIGADVTGEWGNVEIAGNNFKTLDFLAGGEEHYGVYTEGAGNYHINGNSFNGLEPGSSGVQAYGVYAKETPDGGEIYRNTFQGIGNIGYGVSNQMQGDNHHLENDCNEYQSSHYDWVVSSGRLGDQGFCNEDIDGAPQANIFSSNCTNSNHNIFLTGAGIPAFEYNHYIDDETTPDCTNNTDWKVVGCIDNGVIDFDDACPVRIATSGSGTTNDTDPGPDVCIDEMRSGINTIKSQLNGGITEELLALVKNERTPGGGNGGGTPTMAPGGGQPDNTGMPAHIKERIMEHAPMVTKEVLFHTMNRRDISPQDIKDIMIANSPLPRGMMEMLENRQPALPRKILEEVRAMQEGHSEVDKLTDKIVVLQREKLSCMRKFMREELAENNKGAIVDMLESEEHIVNSRMLVAMGIEDYPDKAQEHLEKINTRAAELREFDPVRSKELRRFTEFYQMRKDLHESGRNIYEMNAQEETLVREVSKERVSVSGEAKSILLLVYNEWPEKKAEPVETDMTVQGQNKWEESSETEKQEGNEILKEDDFNINAYPNPFNDDMTMDIYLPDRYPQATILITDIHGRILQQYSVNSGNNKLKLALTDLRKGVYFYRVSSERELLYSDRIIKLE